MSDAATVIIGAMAGVLFTAGILYWHALRIAGIRTRGHYWRSRSHTHDGGHRRW